MVLGFGVGFGLVLHSTGICGEVVVFMVSWNGSIYFVGLDSRVIQEQHEHHKYRTQLWCIHCERYRVAIEWESG